MEKTWMLYGATGYTGALIARACVRKGLRPVLAARSGEKLQQIATELGLAHKVTGLGDVNGLTTALRGLSLVLHCAGPFSVTSAPMRDACLASGVHYLDITGEIDVFEAAHQEHDRARGAGVLLCPGVGFDVVPTDCIAAALKDALPDAHHLDLGFSGVDHLSAGTLVTSMEAVHRGFARVREGGKIVDVPFGQLSRLADFGQGPEKTFVIPWGDVATAYYSTGISNIQVHIPLRSPSSRSIRALLPLRRLIAGPSSRHLVHRLMRVLDSGPSERKRSVETTRIWGEARNRKGETRLAVLEGMNGYSMTVETALLAVEHVLSQQVAGGYQTPSQLLGSSCLGRIAGEFSVQ